VILAIESASTDPSVALAAADGGPLGEDAWTSDRRQGAELLPRLLRLLAGTGHRLEEVSALAVGTGPGSFTGLRVGMALAKGLALALRRPIVGVASLEAWLASEPDAFAAVARAGAHEVYVLARGADGVTVADADVLRRRIGREAVVAPVEVADAFGLANARAPRRAAMAVARAAADRLTGDAAGDELARLEPQYLRAPRGIGLEQAGGVPWR
jgi:tRNA threonylcarbamoyladenosine biosynthesis protein TsaB